MTADFLDTMQGDSGTTSKDQKKKKKNLSAMNSIPSKNVFQNRKVK